MRKLLHIVVFVLLAPLFTWAQGFTTDNTNGNLIDANGNNFIMKGMSVPLQFFQNDVNGSIANVRKNTNANCLRIVMYTYTPDAVWQQCVQNCINNNIVPMVELQEVTGSTDKAELVRMGKYWASKAAYLTQPNIAKYVLINLCNEWGTWNEANSKGTDWRDASTEAIKLMRDAGIKTTIIVDAVGYGQDIDDAKNIRAYAKTMQASDAGFLKANANLMFSIHMYCEWKKGGDNIGIIGDIKKSGVPIMIGEFGFQHSEPGGTCDIDETLIINTCEANKIGWLAWSQKGNGNGVEYLDLCNDWACTSLSGWGNTVVNGTYGTKSSATCSIFLGLNVKAGDDQLVIDVDKNGTESVTLDGSGSSTNSGTISYVWKENGQTLSTVAKPVLNFPAGVHTITLTVSDGVNTPVSDVVVVTVKTPSLAYKKQVVASSTEVGANVPANAVDGDPATRWSSLYADSQTFTVDLQDVYTINKIDILWQVASAKNYSIEVSTDNATWKTIATQNITSTANRTDSIKNLSANARYVRMNGTSRNGTWGYSIFEFEVWGVKPITPTSVTLNKTSLSVEKGLTEKLTATVLPADATDKTVEWTSSNTAVATVDDNGLITAKTAGQSTITAKTTSGGKIATCAVTVTWNGNYIITAQAGANGTITPAGTSSVAPNATVSYNITPAEYYMVESIKIDGKSVATASSYTFSNISADHRIEVTFAYNGISAGLCNPNATAQASSLMSFMREVYGKYIISGQCNEKWLPLIQQKTGDQPAILALDFDGICPSQGGNNGAAKAIDWVKNKGGIVQFQWHWISPNADGDYYSDKFKLGDALADKNSQSFKNMMRDIDLVAGEIKKMQDAGVPIIFRPLHESEGGWFWWGMGTGANLIELYRLMYDRFTNYHQLNNIVWLWNSYGGAKKGNWYPGDDVCDIIGWDYENCDGLNSWDLYSKAFGSKNKLWGLAETGKHPDPNNFAARPWSFFICWDYMIQDPTEPNQDAQKRAGQNLTAWTQTVYSDSKTITLNRLKNFNVYNRVPLSASAGADLMLFDADQNGSETVTLDASASSSNSGNALVYEWRVDGKNIATGAKPSLTLKAGVHKIALVVSDGKNNPAGDEIIITIKTPSLAYKKPIKALTTEVGENVVTNANDGLSDTRWSSLYTDPQWISVDLQDNYRISSIVLQWEAASAKDYKIEFSADGTTWKTIKTLTGITAGKRNDTIANIGVDARHVRITGTARNTLFGYSLYEIEVYGVKANVTQNIALQKGWNLISINVSPADNSIANLFKNVDVAEIKDLNTFWRKGQADAFNSLQTITTGSGYLVNMNAAATLSIVGTASNIIIENPGGTTTGWQLIGCPYQIDTPLSQVFDATNCSVIKNFEGYWIPSIGAITSIKNLEVGKGYFIKK